MFVIIISRFMLFSEIIGEKLTKHHVRQNAELLSVREITIRI